MIGDDGTQIGVMRTDEALRYAQERDLDLVEVAPEARPPVCRVLDYSKYKYEQSQKLKAARKHQQQITIREIKFRPKIAEQDYATKKRHVERFLKHKDKVKITIMFRGREVTHPERGQMILDRLAEELTELAIIEQRPNLDGRNMTMLLGPSKAVLSGTLGKDGADGEDGENGEGCRCRGGHAPSTTPPPRPRPTAPTRWRSTAPKRRPTTQRSRPTRPRSSPQTTPSPRPSPLALAAMRGAMSSPFLGDAVSSPARPTRVPARNTVGRTRSVAQIGDRALHGVGGAERARHAGVLQRRGDRRVGRHDEPDRLPALA